MPELTAQAWSAYYNSQNGQQSVSEEKPILKGKGKGKGASKKQPSQVHGEGVSEATDTADTPLWPSLADADTLNTAQLYQELPLRLRVWCTLQLCHEQFDKREKLHKHVKDTAADVCFPAMSFGMHMGEFIFINTPGLSCFYYAMCTF